MDVWTGEKSIDTSGVISDRMLDNLFSDCCQRRKDGTLEDWRGTIKRLSDAVPTEDLIAFLYNQIGMSVNTSHERTDYPLAVMCLVAIGKLNDTPTITIDTGWHYGTPTEPCPYP